MLTGTVLLHFKCNLDLFMEYFISGCEKKEDNQKIIDLMALRNGDLCRCNYQ